MSEIADTGEVTKFGFTWGPMSVRRITRFFHGDQGRGRVLTIETGSSEIQVHVSEGGQNIRVDKIRGNVRFENAG